LAPAPAGSDGGVPELTYVIAMVLAVLASVVGRRDP
jgi:hypothetical protein